MSYRLGSSTSDGGLGVAQRDYLLTLGLFFLLVVALILILVNDPSKKSVSPPPGQLVIMTSWPDEMCVDVDVWAQAPGRAPVGYSRKSGEVLNLLRDDLGCAGDPMKLNYENIYSRGLPAGEYNVNLHLYSYRNTSSGGVPVRYEVFIVAPSTSKRVVIASGEETLRTLGKELTLVRFRISDQGNLVPGSRHNVQIALRNRAKAT